MSARVCQETARERDELRRALDNACDRVLALLRERDEARAEVERLRAGIEALHVKADDYGEPTLVNMANDLLNPTEGEK